VPGDVFGDEALLDDDGETARHVVGVVAGDDGFDVLAMSPRDLVVTTSTGRPAAGAARAHAGPGAWARRYMPMFCGSDVDP